jgi:protein gp37
MFADKKRYGQTPDVVIRSAKATFNAPLKWAKNREKYGHINRVFPCSWSDFFIEEADAWRAEAWAIIRQTPNLTYQLCTKRPERIAACLPADWGAGYPNVWLMVTAENQPMADLRIPILLSIPAVVHGVSVEPMVGPVDLAKFLGFQHEDEFGVENPDQSLHEAKCLGMHDPWVRGLDWVICGGESGPEARPMHPDWARDLRNQCVADRVPFFFKQWGEWAPWNTLQEVEHLYPSTPTCLVKADGRSIRPFCYNDRPGQRMVRVGRDDAGSLLDGREWKQFPAVPA